MINFGEELPNRKFVTPKIFNDLISMDIRCTTENIITEIYGTEIMDTFF